LLSLALISVLIQTWIGGAGAQGRKSKAPSAGDELFSSTNVIHVQIEISKPELDQLRGRGWSWGWGGATRERPEVQATIREGGHVYTNVALHLKGSAGSFQPVESKPGLTLNFGKNAKGQRFHGLEKISLNNSVQDPSFVTEKICRELFNAAGVPAPRADYATVELNGRKLGLYVLLEGYNRQFLKRHFENPKGNLYDGGFLKDIDSPLAAGAGENPKVHADLKSLAAAANDLDRTTRFARLEKALDMERFITFIAMEVLVCHWDGYAMNKNNYRVYHDAESDRIIFMPHGMDQMFGVMMVQANMAVRPLMQGLVAKAVMDTPEGRRRYFERLVQLNQSLFDVERLTNRVYACAARIQPVLARISPSAVANHEREIADLCDRIIQRKQSLDEQLSGARGQILEFNSAGIALLTGWTSKIDFGSPQLGQDEGADGKTVLHISASRGSSVGSWRTKVLLEEGHYTFEGRMQIQNVAADPHDQRAGAGLRVSGQGNPQKSLGDLAWRDVVYEFDVAEGVHDMELVCELRAFKGEAWFQAESLRLRRK
jgi:hypothetical protein